jgi:hypothetical protein
MNQTWYKGAKGETGLQGPPGKPSTSCICEHHPKRVTTRYINAGGGRSLHPTETTVIIDTLERVSLTLPKIENSAEFPEDYYYYACEITIKSLGGCHRVISTDMKINNLLSFVDLEDGAVKYEFTATPDGWCMLIFRSI